MILPPDFFQLLTQFAANHPVGGSLTAQVLAGAAKRALTTIWRGRPQDNLFDALWKHTVSEVGADWPASEAPSLRARSSTWERSEVSS
jgi:hypothetical protein